MKLAERFFLKIKHPGDRIEEVDEESFALSTIHDLVFLDNAQRLFGNTSQTGVDAFVRKENELSLKELWSKYENEQHSAIEGISIVKLFSLHFSPLPIDQVKSRMLQDTIAIILISYFTAFLGEGLTWLFVYRTERYQKLKSEVDKQSKRLEKQRDVTDITIDRTAKKRLEKQEERLKNISREFSMVKMKSMFAVGIIFTSLFSVFSNMHSSNAERYVPDGLQSSGRSLESAFVTSQIRRERAFKIHRPYSAQTTKGPDFRRSGLTALKYLV
ncbi:unnamed protein product [Dicrocoelium dendriticum]|nr:unnamed protein product [Dicrocoelium dendriticum]